MTHSQINSTLSDLLTEMVTQSGFDILPELVRVIINQAMKIEREQHLGAQLYERTEDRHGYANGYKPKTVNTRLGEITFEIPQVRDSSFYPSALEKGERSERALLLALAEMYIQGVSTRKVTEILEELCGLKITSTQVSRATKKLDETLEAWRNRKLEECPYVYLDARYEHVREDGQVRDAAVLIASGVDWQGKRQILGVSVSLSEAEVHWRSFLQQLVKRGLSGVRLIISDDHTGLKAARQSVFSGVPWQRCQFHLQQNAQAYVPRKSMQGEVAETIRMIFNAPDKETAIAYLKKAISVYETKASRLADWMEHNIEEGLTVFDFPNPHQRRLRTINHLERVNQEVRRRTRVARIFPNQDSCLRLVSALLMEISEKWETDRKSVV